MSVGSTSGGYTKIHKLMSDDLLSSLVGRIAITLEMSRDAIKLCMGVKLLESDKKSIFELGICEKRCSLSYGMLRGRCR